jgi:hypothetical protein
MARMNEDGQWIVMMGFIVSAGIFFLALIISQSTLVGQTTAEAVIEFPKTEIQDLKTEVSNQTMVLINSYDELTGFDSDLLIDYNNYIADIKALSMARQNAVVDVTLPAEIYSTTYDRTWLHRIHYNNGITDYNQNETVTVLK